MVLCADGEGIVGDTPGNGQRVELLDVLAGPNVGAQNTEQNFTLILDNGNHHDPVEDGAHHATNHLDGEGVNRWQVDILCQLQITSQQLSLLQSVEGVASEVHVGQWSTGEDVASQGLANRLNVELETGDTVLSTKDEEEEGQQDVGEQESPPRQG